MVLPAGFGLPPLPYLAGLVGGVCVVAFLGYRRNPRVSDRVVVGFVPWMVAGATLHVLYVRGIAPPVVRPLLGTPAAYLTTGVLAGMAWLFAAGLDPIPGGRRTGRFLAGTGTVVALGALGWLWWVARPISLTWSLVALAVAGVLAAAVWALLWWLRPEALITVGRTATVVIAGHAVDAVSTAVGVDVLGYGERTPASRALIDLAGMLPVPAAVGTTWLFVVVKLTVAALVVVLFADFVRERPSRGQLLLALVAAVGLGPGVHNLVLYAVS